MEEKKYTYIINHEANDFEVMEFSKRDLLNEIRKLLKRPKKIFLGLGDFLEVGDYNKLLDTIFFDEEGFKFENILDLTNSKLSEAGNIPFSFFKMAVYYPDFLLKNVPTFCMSVIGQNLRLFPGVHSFIDSIKIFDPLILSALPYEIAIEVVNRLGLKKNNLLSTEYKLYKDESGKERYAGDVVRFLSGSVKVNEIRKRLEEGNFDSDEVLYIGRGESGVKTFTDINSIAFNPPISVMSGSKLTIYGPTLDSLLFILNFDDKYKNLIESEEWDEFMPSLIVYSKVKDKSEHLLEIERQHLNLQENVVMQIMECSGESFESVKRKIEITFGGHYIDMNNVRETIENRLRNYREGSEDLVKEVYKIARHRYKNFYVD
jgi:hypothetical protein